MKTRFTFLLLLIAMMALAPAKLSAAFDDSGTIYYMRGSDGLDEEVLVDGKITFVSQTGATIPGYKDTGTNFRPANEGEVLKITVDAIDLAGGNYLLLYEIPITQVKGGTSDGVDQSRYLPTGWLYKLTEADKGFSYQSTAENGGLSFGFHSGSASGQKGFTVTIESVALKDMEYSGTEWLTELKQPWRGLKDAVIAGLSVKMDGGLNPLTLNELTLDCSALESVAEKLGNLRLYKSTVISDENLVASAGSGTMLKASDIVLKSGRNNFYVVADINPDGYGDLAEISISALTVNNEQHTPAVASVQANSIANEIRIGTTPTVYVISDPADFYDDGGKDGKIGSKFEGSVTFVPSTPGNAVKVDVTKLAIFNTSSTGLNDVFSFYNGREANEENLLATLLKEARFVKSTAADGSLTVTLKSTTGVPAEGWEATVSEYTPGNMVLSSVNAVPSDYASTVSSMQNGVEMFTLDVVTDNNSNPLSLNTLAFTAVQPKMFKAIDIYAVDKTTETPSRIKIASCTPTALNFVVELERALNEGHNEFVIVASFADNLVNGSKVVLGLNSVKIGENEQAVEANKELEVKNVWQSAEGTNIINVNGEWGFTSTPNESSTGKYAPGLTDQITTFRPVNSGNVIQLDFNTFNVYYASYSSGVRATFEIYNGDSCTDETLIWKADDASKAESGPGTTIRSTAADGSLTIKFNPNSTASYYLGKGWDATVKEFMNHDMEVIDAAATLPTSAELGVGAKQQPLLDFVLTTEGTLSIKKLKKINLSVVNPEALSAIEVYVSTNPDGSSSVLFGRSEAPAAETTIEGEFDLREGKNYFFAKIDVADNAPAETEVSMGLLSIEDAAGKTDAFENCKPEGGRVIKDMLICEPGEHTVVVSGTKMFYDDGGKDGKITSYLKATYTFVPAEEGYAVTLDAKQFSMGNGRINVYNGRSVDDNNKLGKAVGYSTTKGPEALTSKAEDGSITLSISGPSGSTLDGFALELGLHERVPYSLESVQAVSAVPAEEAVRGSANIPLLDVAATVQGDKDASEISNLKFNLAGTTNLGDIKALKLYYSATTETFSPNQATLLAIVENPASEAVSFDASVSTGDNGKYHFFLAADLVNTAENGNVVKTTFESLDFNGETKVAAETSTAAEVAIVTGVSGTFTIGASEGADYSTFKDAVAALAAGMEGPVTFEIEDGTYNENLVIENIKGTSATNVLTVRSKSGSRADVVIKGNYSSVQKEGILRIVSTPYVTVENLSIQAGSEAFDNAIYVGKGSYDVTLTNLDVTADKVTSGYSGINLLRTYSSTSDAGQFNDNLTVKDCHFAGGRIGLYLASNGIVAWPQDRNYRILHNTFEGIGNKAIYATDIRELVVSDNTILEPSPVKNYYATDFYRIKGATISGNRIVNGSENSNIDTNGLYFRTECGATETSPFRVFNNEVIMFNSPSYGCRAIQISNDCNGFEIAYNTFRASGKSVYLFASSGSFVPKGNKFINNVFHSDCTDAVSYPVYFWNATDIEGYEFTGNAFYSAGGSICKNDNEVLDAEGFNTLVGNESNVYEKAAFLGANDSHLAEAGNLNVGTPLEYVSTDRDGVTRDAVHPTLGAYEFVVPSTEAPELYEGYPSVGTPSETSVAILTKWNMGGTLYGKVTEVVADATEETETTPTADEMLAGKGVEISADTENTWNFTDLKPSTSYKACFMAVSGVGNSSEIVSTEVFTTARHIEPLSIFVSDEPVTVNYGEETTLSAIVSGGDMPYTYEWTAQDGEQLSTEESLTVTPDVPAFYTVTVSSADGQTVTARIAVEVEGAPLKVATFEDNFLENESHFTPEEDGHFYSGSFAFYYGGMPDYNFWYGYAPTNETSSEYTGLDDQFRSAVGGGYNSSNFAVAYPQGENIEPVGFTGGVEIPGFYVTNSAYAYSSMTNGDGWAKKFEKGDWFKLKARITSHDGTTTDNDIFYLADLRDENAAEHYIVKDWEYVDLSQFGKIKSITFTFESSDTGTYGINTPTYLCIDNFGAGPDAEEMALTVGKDGVDLSQYFEIDADGTRTSYSVKQLSGEEELTVRLAGSTIYLDDATESDMQSAPEALALVSMLQKGHTQRLALTLTKDMSQGIGEIAAEGADVKVTVNGHVLNILTAFTDYSVEIYSADGMLVYRSAGNSGNIAISRDELLTGIYIVKVKSENAESVHRVLVR